MSYASTPLKLAVSEDQLTTWSHQGAVDRSKKTYASVKYALSLSSSLAARNIEVFLQGSYGNDTNIRADSDVDVVVMLKDAWWRDISDLSPVEQSIYKEAFSDATYGFKDFREDVLVALRSYYGPGMVEEGENSLKVKAASGRLGADVIVCLQYRKYRFFWAREVQDFIEGIAFQRKDGRLIINYPKLHSEGCTEKNKATAGWFKPTVRVFKNMRTRLVAAGKLRPDCAPSYFIENLVHNAPDSAFGTSFQSTVLSVASALMKSHSSGMVCANGQTQLLGDRPEQWSLPNCQQFLVAVASLILGK